MGGIIYKDMGLDPQGQNHELDLPAFVGFAALQNSLTMAKLVLMGGPQLNELVTESLARAPNGGVPRGVALPTTGSPGRGILPQLYSATAAPGAVLIGAVKNIDGDHQWLKFAPVLPPAKDFLTLSDDNAARVSSRLPTGSRTVRRPPGPCRNFGYGENETDAEKRGLLLWRNEAVRRALFNRIFLAPLVPGLIAEKAALGIAPLFPGIETADGDAFPPSRPHPDCVAK